MARDDGNAVALCQRVRQALEMVDLDILAEVLLIEMRHVEDFQDIAGKVDEGQPHEVASLRLLDAERRHHLRYGAFALLLDQEIVEIAEHPADSHQQPVRRVAGHFAQEHHEFILHEKMPPMSF